ncbi:MAG: proline--tRNA ligase [Planctomycetota bacterium]
MSQKAATAITPTRKENYPEWYQKVIEAADLAENSPVRGCMVIKPWGYGIWERIQADLDQRFKDTGHQNAYFPLFIPLRFFEQEAKHVAGFAKECAVVTHHRLEDDGKGGLRPAGELEEPLIVRPTSETIIGASFAKWVKSYRDLPILINQWANVVRWEMRTRLFLRSSEFLWQEGHTAHATSAEAEAEALTMLRVYETFARDVLSLSVSCGEKTESERFPGAVRTYSIEAMMQDGKALQAGTSHFMGQNFAKASGIQFTNEANGIEHAWTTSWGVSTRLIGALVMTHSDDDGLRLPPRVSPSQAVLIPVIPDPSHKGPIMEALKNLSSSLRSQMYAGTALRPHIDARDMRGGEKTWDWIKKGIPLRVEIGPKDLAQGQVCVTRRDRPHKEKAFMKTEEFVAKAPAILAEIQEAYLREASAWRLSRTRNMDSIPEMREAFANDEGSEGVFSRIHWCGQSACEASFKEEFKVTIRHLELDRKEEKGACIRCGSPSASRVLASLAY